MEIREMTIEDYEAVMNLWSETESMLLREADSKENIKCYLNRNPGLSFVAVQQEEIIGAVLVGTDGRRGYLQHLAVAKAARNQGIGKNLVQKSIDALNSMGVAKTHLFVISDNKSAQSFYTKQGWVSRDEIRMFSYISSVNDNV